MSDRPLQVPRNFNADQRTGCQLGNPRRPRDAIIKIQGTIRPTIHPWRGHTGRRSSEAGDLQLELVWISATGLGGQQMQLPGIDVKNLGSPQAHEFYRLSMRESNS